MNPELRADSSDFSRPTEGPTRLVARRLKVAEIVRERVKLEAHRVGGERTALCSVGVGGAGKK